MTVFPFVLCLLLFIKKCMSNDNTNNTGSPTLEYGICSSPTSIPTLSPKYQNIYESMIYEPNINEGTCNFNHGILTQYMPKIYQTRYVVKASMDVYNGIKTDCNVSKDSELGNDECGQSCGVCYRISGPLGTTIYMVNEIDFDNSESTLSLPMNNINEVTHGYNITKDIQVKRVGCPVCGGIYIYYSTQNLSHFTPINHRYGISSIHIRSNNSKWYKLPRNWNNQYYYNSSLVSWINNNNIIKSNFDLLLKNPFNQTVTCTNLSINISLHYGVLPCLDFNGNEQQFDIIDSLDESACDPNVTNNDHDITGDGIWACDANTTMSTETTESPHIKHLLDMDTIFNFKDYTIENWIALGILILILLICICCLIIIILRFRPTERRGSTIHIDEDGEFRKWIRTRNKDESALHNTISIQQNIAIERIDAEDIRHINNIFETENLV